MNKRRELVRCGNCPKVFAVAPLIATLERPDENDIGTPYSEVLLSNGIPQTDMINMGQRPLTDFFSDAFISAPYHYVVGQIHREGIAQACSGLIAGLTETILRGQMEFEMVVVFDPGGCTLDEPILEDMDGVVAKISKVTVKDNSNSIFVGGHCGSGKTEITTMLKHYFSYPSDLKNMQKRLVQHQFCIPIQYSK
ncbi:hypothetical protein EJD97_020494 [Solanum chilense]|uniref:Uncharacterized protein n=1 Tax=Solanum chilense TaxID=4083 RepID=A0A6N2AXS4_SOLCI|nr:hypothetical protein EJD97_020494 [Solanum chilense]